MVEDPVKSDEKKRKFVEVVSMLFDSVEILFYLYCWVKFMKQLWSFIVAIILEEALNHSS